MTFCDACEQNANSSWDLKSTIQSADEAADEFTHVGLTTLLDKKVVVKLMLNGIGARQENIFNNFSPRNPTQILCSLYALLIVMTAQYVDNNMLLYRNSFVQEVHPNLLLLFKSLSLQEI